MLCPIGASADAGVHQLSPLGIERRQRIQRALGLWREDIGIIGLDGLPELERHWLLRFENGPNGRLSQIAAGSDEHVN